MSAEQFLGGRVILHCGDCRDVLPTLADNSIDAVVTDPPYLLGFMSKHWDRVKDVEIDPDFANWFAGFVDGEGCFSVHKKSVNGFETYDCQFSMTLRDDDKPIVLEMQRQLGGLGSIANRPAPKNGYNSKPQVRYCISSQRDCLRLREILMAFPLRAKKLRDFEIWSKALDVWIKHEKNDWQDMAYLRRHLMAVKKYGSSYHPNQLFHYEWAREVYRVLKPGAHLLAFSGTRTYHRMACAIEDAGFEIRDCIAWLYGSGFPKSHDVSKGIDRAAGAEREVIGWNDDCRISKASDERNALQGKRGKAYNVQQGAPITAPATDLAAQWSGWGSALKPAVELVCLARKPLSEGTIAANVLRWSTGALNIDKCRIPVDVTAQRPYVESWEGDQLLCVSCAARVASITKHSMSETKVSTATRNAERITNEKDVTKLGHTQPSSDIGCFDGLNLEAQNLSLFTNVSSNIDESGKMHTEQSRKDLKFTTSMRTSSTTELRICSVCGAMITPSNIASTIHERKILQPGELQLRNPATSDGLIQNGLKKNAHEIAKGTRSGALGRYPANLIHDGSPEVVEAFPEALGQQGSVNGNEPSECHSDVHSGPRNRQPFAVRGDSGSAARFFYTSKADGDDRLGSKHPTVKPLDLMQYLVRLVTPLGGIVLDPFAGTGTTGEAAFREGMCAVLIEREQAYCTDIRRRMALVLAGPDERMRESIKASGKIDDPGPLFAWGVLP